MSLDPHNLLAPVHPDLVRVMQAALQAPQPFQVVYGLRSLAAEQEAVATGHSQTLHSRHLADPNYDGHAMAVDVAALVDGKLSWEVTDQGGGVFAQIAAQVLSAANALGIKVQWGGQAVGAWTDGEVSHFRDFGHLQLDPSAYP